MTTPRVPTVALSAPNMDALQNGIVPLSRTTGDPGRIAAIRIDAVPCWAELGLAIRPLDLRRLH